MCNPGMSAGLVVMPTMHTMTGLNSNPMFWQIIRAWIIGIHGTGYEINFSETLKGVLFTTESWKQRGHEHNIEGRFLITGLKVKIKVWVYAEVTFKPHNTHTHMQTYCWTMNSLAETESSWATCDSLVQGMWIRPKTMASDWGSRYCLYPKRYRDLPLIKFLDC